MEDDQDVAYNVEIHSPKKRKVEVGLVDEGFDKKSGSMSPSKRVKIGLLVDQRHSLGHSSPRRKLVAPPMVSPSREAKNRARALISRKLLLEEPDEMTTADLALAEEILQETPKRGRGRPRKLDSELSRELGSESPGKLSSESPGKLGRPRKLDLGSPRKLDLGASQHGLDSPVKSSSLQPSDESPFKSPTKTQKSPVKSKSPTKSPSKTPRSAKLEVAQLFTPRKLVFNTSFVPTPLPKEEEERQEQPDRAIFLDGQEGYFEQNKTGKVSSNLMAAAPKVTYQEFASVMEFTNLTLHAEHRQTLVTKQRELWHQLWFEMVSGFSIMLYGVGSKLVALNNLVENFLLDRLDTDCVVVNGYNPSCSHREWFKSVLDVMAKGVSFSSTTLDNQMSQLIEYYQTHKRDKLMLLLVIHNIDGESLRREKCQYFISQLAKLPQIRIIATSDHVNAPLLWDQTKSENFSWAYHDWSSYESFQIETSFKDVLLLGQSAKQHGSKGAKYVLSSLTANSKRMFALLITNQIEKMDRTLQELDSKLQRELYAGTVHHALDFKLFYQLCSEEFIASNEISLRAMLREFIEHKMCILSQDAGGTEKLYVPYALGELEKLIEEELS